MSFGHYTKTEEHKEKLQKHLAKVISNPDFGPNLSRKLKGRKFSETHRNNIRLARVGKKNSPESKEKCRKTLQKICSDPKYRKHMSEVEHGSKNHKGLGGTKYAPYSVDWTQTLKRSIRERDFYICQLCNNPQADNERVLCVHHIDYDRQNSSPDNLISLCSHCHGKTLKDRNTWKEFFTSLLKSKIHD